MLTPESTTGSTTEETPSPTASSGASARARTSPPSRTSALVAEHLRPTVKFLLVGGAVFLLDAAMYNLLVFWHPADGWGRGLMHASPLTAKVLTIAIASCLTYLGNRLWTFGDRPRPDTTRSVMLFILVNLIATGLQLSCLGFSRYVLGLDSVLADNIAGTFIGQIVSTSFRYVTYGRLVFPKR
ncbi:GtrA family protein [Brachybacterium sp. AOP43-C2-M15]|uniref:GtrA family protein n=1 Tax=Brachybacterium sp. AOP43-C2-M15 TaxID=3457661 RepID=UPI0040333DC0